MHCFASFAIASSGDRARTLRPAALETASLYALRRWRSGVGVAAYCRFSYRLGCPVKLRMLVPVHPNPAFSGDRCHDTTYGSSHGTRSRGFSEGVAGPAGCPPGVPPSTRVPLANGPGADSL
jgi:hypothetical protein